MTKLVAITALVSLILAACGAPEPEQGPLVLSPSEEAREVTELWAERWSAATGLPVEVREGGAPVLLVDDVWSVPGPHGRILVTEEPRDGVSLCGGTEVEYRGGEFAGVIRILVDRTPSSSCNGGWGNNLGHEMGHALSGSEDHAEDPMSLMAEWLRAGHRYSVDSPALEVVCASADCPVMVTR